MCSVSLQLSLSCFLFFFFKQKTAYDMRISDWSSDVCSSDLTGGAGRRADRDGHPHASHSRRGRWSFPCCLGTHWARSRRLYGNSRRPPWERESGGIRPVDRKSVVEGTSGSVRVDLGGRRMHKPKTDIAR